MPTKQDRKALNQAMNNKNQDQIRMLLQRDDAKELLLMEDHDGWLPVHFACCAEVDKASLQLILDAAVKHGIIKKELEETTSGGGATCLRIACANDLPADSLRLLLDYLSKHADIKKMLEQKDDDGMTCLHCACADSLSTPSLQLLISFFPSNESLHLVLGSKTTKNETPLDLAETEEHRQLLQDPDCWQKCRYWLFCNHQDTFLNTLYPNSPEKTLEALKELNKNYDDDEALKKAIAEVQSRQHRHNDHDDDDKLSAFRKENDELKKKVEVLQEENKQIKEERTALMKQLHAGFG